MSVESELIRIQNNVASAYAAVHDMGGDVPAAPNSDNLAAAVRSIPADGSFPSGGIIIWSGAEDAVPEGWALCDGASGTPDLRGRFVLGASPDHAAGETGGEETHKLTVAEMPSHSHTYAKITSGQGNMGPGSVFIGANQSTGDTGGNAAHNNMPPYYALCYIMKL